MSKHHQQHKGQQTNRVASSISVGSDTGYQNQQKPGSPEESNEAFIPNYEDIQLRAYQIYQEKGGSDLENWLEAERTLAQEKQEQR